MGFRSLGFGVASHGGGLFVGSLEGVPDIPYLREAGEAVRSVGFEPLIWKQE